MTESSKGLHEENLSAAVIDHHRAVVSLMEELEAADWYAQRAEVASDPELREILEHNGGEEKEHASMLLEWLRRKDAVLAGHVQTYLNRPGSIVAAEIVEKGKQSEAAKSASGAAGADRERSSSDGSLGIGSLRTKQP